MAANKRQKREDYRKTHKEDGGTTQLPKKKFYRQRAHANPFSDHKLTYPVGPSHMDWQHYYPAYFDYDAKPRDDGLPHPLKKEVTVADIGCGFGGLLVTLSPMLPDELILGLEIRSQVADYVEDRISALRSQHPSRVDDRVVVFPSYIAQNDSYVATPSPPFADVEGTVEYFITSHGDCNDDVLKDTEAQIKSILKTHSIPSFKDEKGVLRWVGNLTKGQAAETLAVEHVAAVEKNETSSSQNQENLSTTYYDPLTKTISQSCPPAPYHNISVLRANSMKFLPNFFHRNQLTHIFLCFPDPHFKARKHKARIVSSTLCAEYAYVLKPGGCVYTITDVEELANWMKERFEAFGKGPGGSGVGMFEAVDVPDEGEERAWMEEVGEGAGERVRNRREVARMVRCVREETEEGKKVTRNKGKKFVSVWRRGEDPAWPD